MRLHPRDDEVAPSGVNKSTRLSALCGVQSIRVGVTRKGRICKLESNKRVVRLEYSTSHALLFFSTGAPTKDFRVLPILFPSLPPWPPFHFTFRIFWTESRTLCFFRLAQLRSRPPSVARYHHPCVVSRRIIFRSCKEDRRQHTDYCTTPDPDLVKQAHPIHALTCRGSQALCVFSKSGLVNVVEVNYIIDANHSQVRSLGLDTLAEFIACSPHFQAVSIERMPADATSATRLTQLLELLRQYPNTTLFSESRCSK